MGFKEIIVLYRKVSQIELKQTYRQATKCYALLQVKPCFYCQNEHFSGRY